MRIYNRPQTRIHLMGYTILGPDNLIMSYHCRECGAIITISTRVDLAWKYGGRIMAYGHTFAPRYVPV